jgi:hypothetical protein
MMRDHHLPAGLLALVVFLPYLPADPAETRSKHQTTNFEVEAPTEEIARTIGEAAEKHRKQLAEAWLGKELPAWSSRCPIQVTITLGKGGSTSFAFDSGKVLSQEMKVQGTLEQLLISVVPHEVMHTILAHHFRQPVPRWADEGAAILIETNAERELHSKLLSHILETNRSFPLRRLLTLRDYPSDVMVLYGQGYAVTKFLVEKKGRPTFLNFVARGMKDGWDTAAKECYGFPDVERMEVAWLMKSLGRIAKQ